MKQIYIKPTHMKAQTIYLMISAMHKYIQRLSNDSSLTLNESVKQKLRAVENSFYNLAEVAENLNSKSLSFDFKKAA